MEAFRELRRAAQALSQEECERILRTCTTAVLAVSGDGGYPYAVPVNYVYEEGRVLFHGAASGHKLDALRRSDKVSLCVIERDGPVPETLSTDYRSVIVFGRARILETEDEIRGAALRFGLRYNPDRAFVEHEIKRYLPVLCCVEITPEHITGKASKSLIK